MAGRSVGRTASTVGMMEGAFFVSRTDLLQWVNTLLQTSLTKVEQCASGAVYCSILDACHPGTVAMRKVNWMAKTDHEFIPNYKVLQAAFDKNCIERHIAVDMLIRAKYQDNLEFLQWMKCYWEREGAGSRRDYNALQAREGKAVPAWARAVGSGVGAGVALGGKENLRPAPARKPEADVPKKSATGSRSPGPGNRPVGAMRTTPSASHFQAGSEIEDLTAKLASAEEASHELQSILDGVSSERDYYFGKLREVEIFCATNEAHMPADMTAQQFLKSVQAILYAGSDEEKVETSPGQDQSPPYTPEPTAELAA